MSYRLEYLQDPGDACSVVAKYFAHDRNAAVRAAIGLSRNYQDVDILVIRAEIDDREAYFKDTGSVVFRGGRLAQTEGVYR
ncbi:MAG: hypothetical protein AAFO63_08500 [Pseudomonadota bacterium]